MTDVMKALSIEWRDLTNADRAIFNAQATADKEVAPALLCLHNKGHTCYDRISALPSLILYFVYFFIALC